MSDERPFLKKSFAGIVEDSLAFLASGGGGRAALTDITEGSVMRTLVEVFARELAVCYEQLDATYRAGYLDTAEGPALDRVVELLGIRRHEAGWLEGEVSFARRTPAPRDYEIPKGTVVAGKRVASVETIADAILRAGQRSVRVPVRALELVSEPVPPERITIINRPLPGIESVSNPAALLPRREPETDAELRSRARGAVRAGATATISALEQAARRYGIADVSVSEDRQRPGRVQVVIGDPEVTESEFEGVKRAIEEVRPAGIRVDTIQAVTLWLHLSVRVVLEDALDPQLEAALRTELRASLVDEVEHLGVGQTLRWIKIRNVLLGHPRVAEIELREFPLRVVDRLTGEPLGSSADGSIIGTAADPVGVFAKVNERLRLRSADLEIVPPKLPVWVDVVATFLDKPKITEDRLRSGLEEALPKQPMHEPLEWTWSELKETIYSHIGGEKPALSLTFLHSKDGRVVTVSDAADAAERVRFEPREQLLLRKLSILSGPPGDVS